MHPQPNKNAQPNEQTSPIGGEEVFTREWEMIKFAPRERIKVRLASYREGPALPLPAGATTPRFSVLKTDTGLWVANGHLYAGPGFAFFQGKVGELEETLRMVRILHPLFCALEFPDLEGALETLAGFKREEARFYGPYVIAWSGNPEEPASLRKGSVFGDHLLDGAFLKKAEKNPYLKRKLSREMGKACRALSLLSNFPGPQSGQKASLQGSPGSQKGSTNGRNPPGANSWRVLRAGLFLPLLGLEVPRDLSRLKPILHFTSLSKGSWERWKTGLSPSPGEGPKCANMRFC